MLRCRRSISRAMREAHARNPALRHSSAGQRKRCGHCGEEGHNRKTCPALLLEAAATAATAATVATAAAATAAAATDEEALVVPLAASPAAGGSKATVAMDEEAEEEEEATTAVGVAEKGEAMEVIGPAANKAVEEAIGAAGRAAKVTAEPDSYVAVAATSMQTLSSGLASGPASSSGSIQGWAAAEGSLRVAAPAASAPVFPLTAAAAAAAAAAGEGAAAPVGVAAEAAAAAAARDLMPTLRLSRSVLLSQEGGWVFPLPRTKEECVAQAAQAVLRAWDDGLRRQSLELLLPSQEAGGVGDGGDGGAGAWPGGIRQQFRVAKPMVEALLLRLKQSPSLTGRITGQLLDDGDCVGAWAVCVGWVGGVCAGGGERICIWQQQQPSFVRKSCS